MKNNIPKNALGELKILIRKCVDELLCETHPNVCRLRDHEHTYPLLEQQVIERLMESKEPLAIQTVLANLEPALGDSVNEVES